MCSGSVHRFGGGPSSPVRAISSGVAANLRCAIRWYTARQDAILSKGVWRGRATNRHDPYIQVKCLRKSLRCLNDRSRLLATMAPRARGRNSRDIGLAAALAGIERKFGVGALQRLGAVPKD